MSKPFYFWAFWAWLIWVWYLVKLARSNAGNFTCWPHAKRPHMQFVYVTCSLPVKTVKFTCIYAASTSRRIHTPTGKKARKVWVTSPAEINLTYLRFEADFNRCVIAILSAIVGTFNWNCGYFCLQLRVF